jgi:uncharacterized protein
MRVLHPVHTPEERRRLFHEGIDLFNQGRFYDSHEAWEDIWRSTTPEPRDLFQGLIQVAAAMHQFLDLKRNEAPIKTLAKACIRLEPFAPLSHGLDLAGLLADVGDWQAWLVTREGEMPAVPLVRVVNAEAVR